MKNKTTLRKEIVGYLGGGVGGTGINIKR